MGLKCFSSQQRVKVIDLLDFTNVWVYSDVLLKKSSNNSRDSGRNVFRALGKVSMFGGLFVCSCGADSYLELVGRSFAGWLCERCFSVPVFVESLKTPLTILRLTNGAFSSYWS